MAKNAPVDGLVDGPTPSHDPTVFDCGRESLNTFLKQLATQYHKRDLGRTYVAVTSASAVVRGYYTISTGEIALADLPEEVRRKLPRHPVPVARLGRLAVDVTAQGQGLGEV